MANQFFFYIDVVSTCNLRCPSCPIGNSSDVRNDQGVMDSLLLGKILEKAKSECEVAGVGLYNWTEPLLHPKLPDLVNAVKSSGIWCGISSNLNKVRSLEGLFETGLDYFRISLSGFTQETYQITHTGGHIEKVKRNMEMVANAAAHARAKTVIEVCFLRYLTNLDEEELAREFAGKLGFKFRSLWGLMLPLEKVFATIGDTRFGELTLEDRNFLNKLALPLNEALDAARRDRSKRCTLLEDQIVLDVTGKVMLCCAVYDSRQFRVADFLSTPLAEIQKRRRAMGVCGSCMDRGADKYFCHTIPNLDGLGIMNVEAEGK